MKKVFFLSILIFLFSCGNKSSNFKLKESKNSTFECINLNKMDSLITNILRIGQIYGYSEEAKNRGYEVIQSNDLIKEGKEYLTNWGNLLKSIDSTNIKKDKITGGIIEFRSIEFNMDSTESNMEIMYYGNHNRAYQKTLLSFEFKEQKCEWLLVKSNYIVF